MPRKFYSSRIPWDEADVKVDSFLWRVLTGNCKAVEGLKVIICSRPCEKTSWLARTYLFDRASGGSRIQ